MKKNNPDITVQGSIAEYYDGLSKALKLAADFIIKHRFEVATQSLRSIATISELSPASFSRLARAIGFEDYEQLKECARDELASSSKLLATKAKQLHDDAKIPLLPRQIHACVSNVQSLLDAINQTELEAAVDSLEAAEKITIIGSLGSAAFADYFAYLTGWFDDRWSVAGRNGVTLASSLARASKNDVIIVISKAPYAKRAVLATEMAAERGATIIILTDSHAFPPIKQAKHAFIQRSESPQFFSSYAATLVLIETLAGMLLSRAGPQAIVKIESLIEKNQQLDEILQVS